MLGLILIAWATLGAWAYQDASRRAEQPEVYPVLAQWSPLVWCLQVLVVPGFGLLAYVQARRPLPAEEVALPSRWRTLFAPAGLMILLLAGFVLGTLTAIPTSKAIVPASTATAADGPAYRLWQGQRRLTAAADGIRYTVLDTQRLPVISHATGEARPSGEFLVVRLGIRNEGSRAELLSPSRFALVDPQGRQYTSSFAGETALLFKTGRSLALEARQPGLESEGDVVFDVPKQASNLKLAVLPLDPLADPAELPLP